MALIELETNPRFFGKIMALIVLKNIEIGINGQVLNNILKNPKMFLKYIKIHEKKYLRLFQFLTLLLLNDIVLEKVILVWP